MKYPRTSVAILIMFCVAGGSLCQAQTFENANPDSKESPYIQRLVVSTAEQSLVLRFEGTLGLGREMNAVRQDSSAEFHHADRRLIVTLKGEALDDLALTIGPDDAGKELTVIGGEASIRTDEQGVDLIVPLTSIKYSPIEISAESHSIYFIDDNMTATEGANIFSVTGGGPAKAQIAGLPVKPDEPVATGLEVTDAGVGAVIFEWQTNNRTTTKVTLATQGEPDRTEQQEHRTFKHRTMVAGLRPDSQYMATVTGSDFASRPATAATISFRTSPAPPDAENDLWLRVRGKYIVDSTGTPFPLGAYAANVQTYWRGEFPRYGTLAMSARYFRSMGFNSFRMGLADHKGGYHTASIMRDGSAFERYGGPAGYVKDFLRPLVDQVINEGIYVIIDWHWTFTLTLEDLEKIGQFWEACAIEFKDEPRVAVFQLLNEPHFSDGDPTGACNPALAQRIRDVTKDYIARIRKHDNRHIILVSDWNCGWGWATESQWAPVNFDPGDPSRQIIYSKHAAKAHMTHAFMKGGVDAVVDRWNVPIIFDELQSGELMDSQRAAWFYEFVQGNPRKYGFAIWLCQQYPPDFERMISSFAQQYLPRPRFGSTGAEPIVEWFRLNDPQITKGSRSTYYRYKPPKELPAGDYGLVVESAQPETSVGIAIVPSDKSMPLIGTWIGSPRIAQWGGGRHPLGVVQSAVRDSIYFHALKPFTELVVSLNKEMKEDWLNIQVFRLNPEHQMPVPEFDSIEVKMK